MYLILCFDSVSDTRAKAGVWCSVFRRDIVCCAVLCCAILCFTFLYHVAILYYTVLLLFSLYNVNICLTLS